MSISFWNCHFVELRELSSSPVPDVFITFLEPILITVFVFLTRSSWVCWYVGWALLYNMVASCFFPSHFLLIICRCTNLKLHLSVFCPSSFWYNNNVSWSSSKSALFYICIIISVCNALWFNSYAPELVLIVNSVIQHGYRCFIS